MTSPGWMAHHCVTGLGWPGCPWPLLRALGDTGLRVGCGWSRLFAGMSGFQGTGGYVGPQGAKKRCKGSETKFLMVLGRLLVA